MPKKFLVILGTIFVLNFFFIVKPVSAESIAGQTQFWQHQLTVWQLIQELGDNLSGKAEYFTFRTLKKTSNQYDYTAQNTRIYDKTTNTNINGCVPAGADPHDQKRGLIITTDGVPAGFEDVTINFSCRNYNFIPGHRYLIFVTNANKYNQMTFTGAGYGASGDDFFNKGGLRYANGNRWDYGYNSGSCDPVSYIWGDTTGHPRSGCNIWTSVKDDLYFKLSNDVPEPTPTPTPTPGKTPLIFIPGIGGSELKVSQDTIWVKDDGHGGTYNHAYSAGEKVWVNEGEAAALGDDDYFDVLRMKSDGQTGEANLELTGNMYNGSYGSAINFFTANGYTLDQDLFVFPYDWRKDVALTAPLLDQKIESIKIQTGAQKVDIVAHSLGGLVARNYISDPNRAGKVRKLVTLGTPSLGTPYFLKVLMYGDCLTDPRLKDFSLCIGVNPVEMKDVSRNMLSGFELSPSQKYYDFYNGSDSDHPFPFVDNRDIDNNGVLGFLNYQQIKTMLAGLNYNVSLFSPSENFHNLDSSLANTNGVDVSIISGSGMATTGQIIEDYMLNFSGIKIPKTDIRKINGDDTVPLFSSSLTDGSKSIAGSAKVYYTREQHSNLVSDGPSMNMVKNILVGDATLPSGVNNQPFAFSGNALSVHSPVLIHAYDQSGNHTGPLANGDWEAKIPGSTYEVLGDAKFIFLPNDGQYNLKFEATGDGSFDFKIRNYQDNANDKTVLYKNVPLAQNTKAETNFNTASSEAPILQIDSDGNGTVDNQVNSSATVMGNANFDQTAPMTSIQLSGNQGNNDWYKSDVTITLSTSDEGGSGVLKTEYLLNNGETVQEYTAPFTIPGEGINKLKFRSIDKSGNEEIPQEVDIKIDKTMPVVTISANPDNIWPPNKKLVDVKISGSAGDTISGLLAKTFSFEDEYKTISPSFSDFGQTIKVEAWRNGDDKDGRIYTLKVMGEDLAGNKASAEKQVIVPHDQSRK